MAAPFGILLATDRDTPLGSCPSYVVWPAVDAAAASRIVQEHAPNLAIVDAAHKQVMRVLDGDTGPDIILLGEFSEPFDPRVICKLPQDIPASVLVAMVGQVAGRVEAEQALAQGRDLLHSAGDSLPFGFYTKDRQGRKTFSSRMDYFGLGHASEESVLGKTDLELLSLNDGMATYQNDMELMRTGEPLIDHEERFKLPNGQSMWVLTSKVPLRDASGEIIGLAGSAHNVTEKKALEEALQSSQARLRASFDSAAVGMAILRQGRFVEANDATIELFGYARDELLTMRIKDITHPDDLEANRESLRANLESGEPVVLEVRHISQDGQIVWCLTSLSPIQDRDGQRLFTVVHFQDITSRKKAEEALRRSEARFRASFDHSAVGMALVAANGQIIEINDQGLALFGYTRQELLGKRFGELTHPEDPESSMAAFQSSVQSGKPFVIEERYLTKSGETLWALTSVSPIMDDQGRLLYAVGHLQDITERKRAEQALLASEERFRALMEQSSVAIGIFDTSGRLEQMNQAYLKLYGLRPALVADVCQRYNALAGAWATSNELGQAVERAFAGQEVTLTDYRSNAPAAMEAMGLPSEGIRRPWLRTRYYPLRGESGKARKIVVMHEDITERRQAEIALREWEQVLEQAQQVAMMGSWVWHMAEERMEWSEGMYALFGLDAETFDGDLATAINEFVHPEDRHLVGASTSAMMERGEVRSAEYRIVRADGDIRHIWAQAGSLVKDSQGRPISLVGIMQDITERVEAERAVMASEARFRAMVEQSPLGVAMFDATGALIELNDAFCAIHGLDPGTIDQMIGHVNLAEAGRRAGGEFGRVCQRAFGGEAMFFDVHPSRAAYTLGVAGLGDLAVEQPWVRTHYFPIKNADGDVMLVTMLVEDVTETVVAERAQQQSEARFRALMEQSPTAIAIFGPDGTQRAMNEAYASVNHLTPEDVQDRIGEFNVLRWSELHSPEMHAFVKRAFAGEAIHIPLETSRAKSDLPDSGHSADNASETWLQWTLYPIKDSDGATSQVVLFQQDVTEAHESEQALKESEARFRALVEQSPMGMAVFNVQGDMLHMNSAFREINGIDKEMERVLLDQYNIIEANQHTDDGFAQQLGRVFEGESIMFPEHISHGPGSLDSVGLDGSKLKQPILRSYYYPIKDADGRVVSVVLVDDDVTEMVEAATAQRQSEERFRALMEQSPVGIAIFEPDGTMSAMNQAYADGFGFSPQAVQERIGRINLLDAVALRGDETQPLIESAFAGATVLIPENQSRASKTAETLGFTQGTRNPWVRSRYFPILDDQGNVSSVVLFMEDVTESHEAQNAILAGEERYRTLFENMTQGVFYQAASGEITDLNEAAVRIFGLTRDQILGRTKENPDWYVLDDDGRRIAPDQFPSEVALRTGEPVLDRTVGVRNLDHGRMVWLNVNALPLFEEGETAPSQVFVTMEDITAQRDARQAQQAGERELRHITSRQEALLTAIPDIVTETDINKTFAWVNAAGIEFFGDDVVGRQASDYFIGEQETYEVVDPIFKGSEETIYVESWQRRRDGEQRLLAWWCRTLTDDDDKVIGALSTARDITDQRRLEQQYLQSQKMESVGRLAGGVAHDFNNMLQVILGHTEMALDEVPQGSDLREDLTEVQKAAQRSARLTAQLLGFARQQTVSPEVLDLNDAIARMLRMLQRLIGEEIDLVWKPGAGLGSVRIDPSQLDQILANLCVNARDAIAGIGEVIIETRNVDLDFEYCRVHSECQPGHFVMLSVSDNGSGMDDQVLSHLFEPFFTTKDVDEGTGLGLATVYGIIKQNDGFVNVYSEVGEGTTFRIYLPRLRDSALDAPAESRGRAARGLETILVVEDEPTILRLAQSALRRQGYTVLTASKPSDALKLLASTDQRIDLLVTDVVMPEMNGREMRDRILESRPDLKTLFMSGYTADVVVHRGVIEEGLELLQKPFSIRDLAAKVRDVLDA